MFSAGLAYRMMRLEGSKSMTSWFGKKKTPDGTTIVRHGAFETEMGVAEQYTVDFRKDPGSGLRTAVWKSAQRLP